MNKLLASFFALLLGLVPVGAQQVTNPQPNAGTYAAYNSSLPTCVNGSGCWLQTDLNGNLKIAIASGGGSGGTASTFGAAFPAIGTAVGFTDGTNMVSGRVRNPGSGAVTGDAAIVVVDPNVLAAVNSASPWRAQNVEQTATTNGSVIPAAADLTGKLITLPYANPENFLIGQVTSAMVGVTPTAMTGMGAQGGSFRNYITACTFSNSHATVGTMIILQDGSGGTTLWQAPAAPAYGGAHTIFPVPLKTTANTALFAANVTTGSSTFVSCDGYKGI